MARRHKSLQNENFGGYRINGRPASREDYAAVYNGEYDKLSPDGLSAVGFDEDLIAMLLGQGLTRQGGNY